MIQRDYMLRLIADLAEFIAKLLKLSKDEVPQAYDEVVLKMEELYGVDFDCFVNMESEALLKTDWSMNSGIADQLGDFMMIAAKVAMDNQKIEVYDNLLRKALYLFELSESVSKTYSFDRTISIQQIKEMLGID